MMGIYYAAPLLGPSMGPLLGGILTQLFNWRATFWFLVIFGVLSMVSFMLFKDTFRRERSLAYQAALHRIKEQMERAEKGANGIELESTPESQTQTVVEVTEAHEERKENDKTSPVVSDVSKAPVEKSGVQRASQHIQMQNINLSLKDINPITPLILILRRKNNVAILTTSGDYMRLFSDFR